ncbi:glycosyltransferase family 2 protein [bacterium]|nr:glycosyltransferase family 2 protein [bacterium]
MSFNHPQIPKVQVFILTHNRPEYLGYTLQSVLNQNFEDYSVIVSDNSTTSETELMMQEEHDPRLLYIRRNPTVPPIDHFNLVLTEAKSKYFMIFHDDDIMEPDCLKILSTTLDGNSEAVAVGGNASIFWNNNRFTSGKFIKKSRHNRTISSSDELAKAYLLFDDLAPFPSYMYRTQLVDGIKINLEEGGKHADVSFLMKVLERGSLIWENQCVMRYRKHTSQDSQAASLKDMTALFHFIFKNTSISKKNNEVKYYRYKTWAGRLKSKMMVSNGKLAEKKLKKIYWAIFLFSPFDIFFRLFIWQLYFTFRPKRTRKK